MEKSHILKKIKNIAESSLPAGSSLWLYGSHARNDAHKESDWDLLILLDKPEMDANDYGYAYPFRLLGWEIGEEINPTIYTKKQWDSWTFLPYYKNVNNDKIVII